MRAIIVEGASTAYGMDAGDYGGWVAQLRRDQQTYNQQHRTDPEVVIDRSLPGLTLPYFNGQFSQAIPRIVDMTRGRAVRLLSVGINEAKIMHGREKPIISLARFAVDLALYAEDSAGVDLPTIYVGSNPIDEARTKPVPATGSTIEDDLVWEYDELIRAQAHESGMPFVDVRTMCEGYELDEVLAADGYHPNELGHRIIYMGVHEALTSLGFDALAA